MERSPDPQSGGCLTGCAVEGSESALMERVVGPVSRTGVSPHGHDAGHQMNPLSDSGDPCCPDSCQRRVELATGFRSMPVPAGTGPHSVPSVAMACAPIAWEPPSVSNPPASPGQSAGIHRPCAGRATALLPCLRPVCTAMPWRGECRMPDTTRTDRSAARHGEVHTGVIVVASKSSDVRFRDRFPRRCSSPMSKPVSRLRSKALTIASY